MSSGAATPSTPPSTATRPERDISRRSTPIPAMNIISTAPNSARFRTVSSREGESNRGRCSRLIAVGPRISPARSSPRTAGCRKRTLTQPLALATRMIIVSTSESCRKGLIGLRLRYRKLRGRAMESPPWGAGPTWLRTHPALFHYLWDLPPHGHLLSIREDDHGLVLIPTYLQASPAQPNRKREGAGPAQGDFVRRDQPDPEHLQEQ